MSHKVKLFYSNVRLRFARILAERKWSRFIWIALSVIVLISVTSLVLGYAYGGFCIKTEYGASPYKPDNIIDAAYYLLFTNGGQNLYDGSDHWLGIIITTFGIVFIAVLTSMITNAFERISQNYLTGESTFLMEGHVVIIGTSDVIYSILSSKKKNPKTRFLIMTSQDVIEKRREVLSFLNETCSDSIVFLHGDRTSSKDIDRLSIAYASEVFIIGDSEENDSLWAFYFVLFFYCLF